MDREPLSDLDLRILEFESRSWRLRGSKENAIRDEFKISSIRYYYLLSRLIERPEAEERSPILVHRLRRLRDQTIKTKRRTN